MGNCLVTKLKGVVDNDNLPIFGYYKINLRDLGENANALTNGLRDLSNDVAQSYKIKIISGTATFANRNEDDSLTSNGLKSATISVSNKVYFLGEGTLLIPDTVSKIVAVPGATSYNKGWYVDTAQFRKSKHMGYIQLVGTQSTGSLYDFVECPNFNNLTFTNCPEFTGDIVTFIERWIDYNQPTIQEGTPITMHIGGINSGCTHYPGHSSLAEYDFEIDSLTQFRNTTSNMIGRKVNGVWTYEDNPS